MIRDNPVTMTPSRSQKTRIALSWYFGDAGRGRRTMAFIFYAALLVGCIQMVLTLVDGAGIVIGTIFSVHGGLGFARETTVQLLGNQTALYFVTEAEQILRDRFLTNLVLSTCLGAAIEIALTVRRAERQMPPMELLEARVQKDARPA
ncbi:hypothetical protein [Paraburkholderia youngii]|uniref:hypothetical protein n=1 Tax=Paraburkholderia youngii TaxID=2782701 RepID=UPI003D24CC06